MEIDWERLSEAIESIEFWLQDKHHGHTDGKLAVRRTAWGAMRHFCAQYTAPQRSLWRWLSMLKKAGPLGAAVVSAVCACIPDNRVELAIERPKEMSCSDFQSLARLTLRDLPLIPLQGEGWRDRDRDMYVSFEYAGSTPASLYLVTSKADCQLTATWYHASADQEPTVENKKMLMFILDAFRSAFGNESVRVTREGQYFES